MFTRPLCERKMMLIFHKLTQHTSVAWNLDPFRWDWSAGVGMVGVCAGQDALGEESWRTFLERWLVRIGSCTRQGSVNHVVPANVALFLEPRGGGEHASALCDRYAHWCRHDALRTSNGGWAHVWEGGDPDYCHQLWVDTIFMAALFLARYGVARRDKAAIDEALTQINLHVECLFDPAAGLFRHAYHCTTRTWLGEHWGRGNGWMVASLAEMVALFAASDRPVGLLRERFVTAMETAYRHQAAGGFLRTLPLVEESYLETTGSSLFGYAALRGHALGVLPDEYRDWGLQIAQTVAESVDAEGRIPRCSHGTNPESRAIYLGLPFSESLYADGIVLMLLAQAYPHLDLDATARSRPVVRLAS